ncbi:Dps family protein [Bradyrhizobium sp. STM 3557]|uniref:Dps family protein n=1 Tax=Bradyrhizobium sp. STM 3557 TaxID=578920 RepID=UPI00388E5270
MGTAVESRRASAVIGAMQNFPPGVANEISTALTDLLADVFTLYLKTENFHWHMSGRHFRDYQLLLDEQADQVDAMAERCRKVGGRTIRSIGEISHRRRLMDSDALEQSPGAMLNELQDDNLRLVESMRDVHALCERYDDVASASALENWIDEAERRIWFLFEAARD